MGLARDVPSPAKGGVRPCPTSPGQNTEEHREQSPPPLLEHPWVPPERRDAHEVRQKITRRWATASQGDAELSSSSLPEVCGLQG